MRLHRFSFILLALVLLVAIGSFPIAPVSAQEGYAYAYLAVFEDQTAELRIVDPVNLSAMAERRAYAIPPGWYPPDLQAFVSPTGEWVAFTLYALDNRSLLVQLFNVRSGETREIAQGSLSQRGQSIVWSPDGRVLTLNIVQDGGDVDIYLYSVADATMVNLTNDDANQRDIAWSADSNRIATFTEPCPTCASRLEIFNISSNQPEFSLDLSLITLEGTESCNPTFSPDARYVGFQSNCGFNAAARADFPNEVYLWNPVVGSLEQVTNVSAEVGGARFSATYNLTWYDAQTLLVGVNYETSTTQNRQVLSYQADQKRVSALATEGARLWSLAPLSRQVILFDPQTTGARQGQLEVATLDFTDQAATLSTQVVSRPVEAEIGYGLQWIPGGQTFAYTLHEGGDSRSTIESIVFVDPFAGTVQQHSLTLDGMGGISRTMGLHWTRVEYEHPRLANYAHNYSPSRLFSAAMSPTCQ